MFVTLCPGENFHWSSNFDLTSSFRCKTEGVAPGWTLNFTKRDPRCSKALLWRNCQTSWTQASRFAQMDWHQWSVDHSVGLRNSHRVSFQSHSPFLNGINKLVFDDVSQFCCKSYQVHWRKAFQGGPGRNVNRAGERVVRHNQSQTCRWQSRGTQPRQDHRAINSSEIRAFSIRHKMARDPCSWVVSVGAPLISCSGTRPEKDNKRVF